MKCKEKWNENSLWHVNLNSSFHFISLTVMIKNRLLGITELLENNIGIVSDTSNICHLVFVGLQFTP